MTPEQSIQPCTGSCDSFARYINALGYIEILEERIKTESEWRMHVKKCRQCNPNERVYPNVQQIVLCSPGLSIARSLKSIEEKVGF